MIRLSAPVLVGLLAVLVAGCATSYAPRYGADGVYYDGVYYDDGYDYRGAPVHAANPVYYPYWSLDYFYFSRHYHPYSVFVGYHDPFFYPYPGWYYGYRPGARFSVAFSGGHYYPWFGFGPRYHHFRPAHFGHFGHFGFGHHQPVFHDPHARARPIRRVDSRLLELQRRDTAAARTGTSQRVTLSGAVRAQQRAAQRGAPGNHRRGVPRDHRGAVRGSRGASHGSSNRSATRSTRPATRSQSERSSRSSRRGTIRGSRRK